jgi:hypothetical protein
VIQPVGERIVGPLHRWRISPILYTDEVIVPANSEIDEEAVIRVEESGLDRPPDPKRF